MYGSLTKWYRLFTLKKDVNYMWPSNDIWWHRSGSTFSQVMTCCLMAPSHSLKGNGINDQESNHYNTFENNIFKLKTTSCGEQWVNLLVTDGQCHKCWCLGDTWTQTSTGMAQMTSMSTVQLKSSQNLYHSVPIRARLRLSWYSVSVTAVIYAISCCFITAFNYIFDMYWRN